MHKTIIVVTDLTRMGGNRVCLAGYAENGTCVRPELPFGTITEPWLYLGSEAVVRPFARIELELARNTPHPPHTEDWLIGPRRPVHHGMLAANDQLALLSSHTDTAVEQIFGAPVQHDQGWWVAAGTGRRSLGTVRACVWDVIHKPKPDGGWHYRILFSDEAGRTYELSVTDLAFRYFLDHERTAGRIRGRGSVEGLARALRTSEETYLRVGLARNWARRPGRCYLQVNGVYSFPDYLHGRCFADFVPPPSAVFGGYQTAMDFEDLPF